MLSRIVHRCVDTARRVLCDRKSVDHACVHFCYATFFAYATVAQKEEEVICREGERDGRCVCVCMWVCGRWIFRTLLLQTHQSQIWLRMCVWSLTSQRRSTVSLSAVVHIRMHSESRNSPIVRFIFLFFIFCHVFVGMFVSLCILWLAHTHTARDTHAFHLLFSIVYLLKL